ncbi:MAG: HlyD family efflux transporter periplasmic adaptor subunit [Deltaproteobacteria bacterium]|nr:HlyD family efflux transporter periplasmic adaptor subunit [Deltaproteobacteria bacterium]MBI3065642.1 HlyD family efflux transporter periplasmic adaptor subunit [Deltaproteobacteria bacterium]
MADRSSKKWLIFGVSLVAVAVAVFVWQRRQPTDLPEAIVSGNGRIEATEYDIATKQPGRIVKVLAREGEMVEPDQVLVQMDTAELETDLREAESRLRQAREDKNQALATVSQRESDLKQIRASIGQRESEIKQAGAAVSQRESELALAITQFERARALVAKDFIAKEEFDRENSRKQTAEAALVQEQARKQAAEAMLALEQARLQSAEAALRGARIEVAQRDAAIDGGVAKIQKIKTIIDDAVLKSPIRGRVLYRLAEPGEVLPAGGKVLTVLELTDVYMTIFLPTALAGRLAVGAEARIILDAVPQYVIPAAVSFVAPRSQFTPKEVETRTEREKLMFRVKVNIDPELLQKHVEKVKSGLPGVAYVRLDGATPWPEYLNVKLPP